MIAVCTLPPVRIAEVLRYAGAKEETPELSSLLAQILEEADRVLAPGVCWQEFPLNWDQGFPDAGFAQTVPEDLSRRLAGCSRMVVFAATTGIGLDRLILRYGKTAPTKALLLQAVGAERIEALCDAFQEQIRRKAAGEGLPITGRFSPGYGDLPLEFQRELFRVLDCSRQIGLTLTDSCMMSPSKSVTAIIGIGACSPCSGGCAGCTKTDCIHRRAL